MSISYPKVLYPKLFRHYDGVLPNFLAFSYTFGGYAAGWWLITRDVWLLNAAGILLLAHAMIIAAYLIHECAHNTLFADNANNARFGGVLLWLTGACYGRRIHILSATLPLLREASWDTRFFSTPPRIGNRP